MSAYVRVAFLIEFGGGNAALTEWRRLRLGQEEGRVEGLEIGDRGKRGEGGVAGSVVSRAEEPEACELGAGVKGEVPEPEAGELGEREGGVNERGV